MWDVVLAAGAGSFLGSAAGMIYSLKSVTRILYKKIGEDPELEKIEINVTLNEASR